MLSTNQDIKQVINK